ncbi:hypothetical protein MHBO_004984 [Bonamia ostreae]|uniref:Uncharacterized protein n=1 Tax=Bonamia ostreae TaxID=126728 RepID=A0ABV2AUT8_9EUKA
MRALCELSDNVTDQQVEEVRNKLVTAALSPIDSTDELCEELGRQVLTCGRKMPAAEFVARLNAVDASAVRLAAKRFIYDKDLSLSAVGPIVELPPYPWFRRHTYSLTH